MKSFNATNFPVLATLLVVALLPAPAFAQPECALIPSVDTVISNLNLVPRQEGGWMRQTFRSNISVKVPYDAAANRSALASMYYVLQDHSPLGFHLPQFSETWSYYFGSHSVTIYEILQETGELRTTVLGNNITANSGTEVAQHTIEAGTWYAAKLNVNASSSDAGAENGYYALIGNQAGPAFELSDWNAGNASELVAQFPNVPPQVIFELSLPTTSNATSTRPTTQPPAHACVFPSVQELVQLYNLVQHPEGGFFVETFVLCYRCKALMDLAMP